MKTPLNMPDAIDIGSEGIIDRRIEIHQARAIDNDAHAARQLLQSGGIQPAIGLPHVTGQNRYLVLEECRPESCDDGCQGRRGQGLLMEPFPGRKGQPRPEQQVDALQVRKAIEENTEHDLAQEPVSPGQQDLMRAKCLTNVYHRLPLPAACRLPPARRPGNPT